MQPDTAAGIRGRGGSIGKYLETGKLSLLSNTTYFGDYIARSFLMVVFIFTFAMIWTKTLQGGATAGGLTPVELVWYMALTETVMLSLPRLEGTIVSDVKTGGIAYLIGRPMDYLTYQYSGFMGEASIRFLTNGVIGATTAWFLVGPIHIAPWAIPAWILGILLGSSLSFFMSTCIGLCAFWLEDVIPFFWIYNKFLMTLGGLFAPISIYPGIFRVMAKWTPFGSVFATPARLLVDFTFPGFYKLLATQIIWLVLAVLLARWIYAKGVKKVNVNGG